MNRKSLLLCLSILAVMMVGIGVAVAFLYSGTGSSRPSSGQVADEGRYMLLPAVPSDAVAVFCFSEAEGSCVDAFSKEIVEAAGDARIAMSLHHSGKTLSPLYVIDAGRASDASSVRCSSIIRTACANGMFADSVSCGNLPHVRKSLSDRVLVVASPQENLVKSSLRHLQSAESVMDASGFAEVSSMAMGNDIIFLADTYSQKLMNAVMARSFAGYSSFFSRFAEWTAFDVKGDLRFCGISSALKDQADFMTVLDASQPAVSGLASLLPSYVVFSVSLPMKDVDAYLSAYEEFLDSRQQLASYKASRKSATSGYGMAVEDLLRTAGISEVATASFKVAGKMERVNLIHPGKDACAIFCPESASKGYVPAVHEYGFAGFVGIVFGKLFSLEDESYCTCVNGWIVSGSRKAVEEYVGNGALEYTLEDKMKDAGVEPMSAEPSVFQAYFSFTEDKDGLSGIFAKGFLPYISSLTDGYDYCPLTVTASRDKKKTVLEVELARTSVKRTKAPLVERDTTVVIPDGPFEVKNSGTGKMNRFYQNSHMSICLSEDGKDLWGIPFQQKICGIARTIDYYANGKLQILFGAGNRMYLIDRLGRFVTGFPVTLGKEILLGPEPYDFNGVHKYNVMVLHKDNTIEMYNLKGQKPDSWQGIKAEETIKALPQRISAGGKSYWIVRTSVQTLVFPFMGGTPLTVFEGDGMIRPDSEIVVQDDKTLAFECYDGKKRTLKL
jgi:hypothetical protein